MKKNLAQLFDPLSSSSKPLIILDMANNHMGDVNHGLRIIREFHQVTKKFDFPVAFKFQFRDIAGGFIHPDYKKRLDIKYVKRFQETRLAKKEYQTLKKELVKRGYITMCTPFDEPSVDLIEELNFDILKLSSYGISDWPLLERAVKVQKPIIGSTGGNSIEEIDRFVSFMTNRNKIFGIEHCVSEYPTKPESLQLNQIDFLKNRYKNFVVGFSTHEETDNFEAVQVAIAKGARFLEKHVAVKTEKYDINNYSATPEQLEKWLMAADRVLKMAGLVGIKAPHSEKELTDRRVFMRGVFIKQPVKKGELIDMKNVFFAFPNQAKQLLANDTGKYRYIYAKKDIEKNGPVIDPKIVDTREKVYTFVKKIDKLLEESGVTLPNKVDLEISHHYGIDKFYKFGMSMITCVNRDYCKKLLVMLPGQYQPEQLHKKKEETFHILHGKFAVLLNGKKTIYDKGEVITVKPWLKHIFYPVDGGGILEEISSTHFVDDSFYTDKKISQNKNRKTFVSHWRNV